MTRMMGRVGIEVGGSKATKKGTSIDTRKRIGTERSIEIETAIGIMVVGVKIGTGIVVDMTGVGIRRGGVIGVKVERVIGINDIVKTNVVKIAPTEGQENEVTNGIQIGGTSLVSAADQVRHPPLMLLIAEQTTTTAIPITQINGIKEISSSHPHPPGRLSP